MAQNNKQLTHIGTSEFIDFPDDAVFNVPAKIDTGADSSAIWASNVVVEDGALQFNFFAPGSVFYKSDPTRTTAFKSTVVKNSFGHREVRYKIRLKVQVGTRKFTTWFSLADRSRSTYPILLGKTFLEKRFIVDVSQNLLISAPAGAREVLVLGGSKQKEEFFQRVEKESASAVRFICADYDMLRFEIDGTHTRISNLADDGRDIATYDFIYFKNHIKDAELAAATAEYLKYRSRRFIDFEVGTYTSSSKLSEVMRLATHGMSVPKTIVAEKRPLLESYDYIAKALNVPFVLKEIASDRGRNNYLIANKEEFIQVLSDADPAHIYMAQKYIENDGFMRLYVFGHEVSLAIWRSAHTHTNPMKRHLNKPAGGINASKLAVDEVASEVIRSATMAADVMRRQIAGVDMVQDKHTNQWYILEVNNAPQLRSGSFINEKVIAVARFFEKELNR